MVEPINGHWLAMYVAEVKAIPGDLLRRKVEERCKTIEETTGRQPGKRERKQLKEDITQELMPHAFPKRWRVPVWIDPMHAMLGIGTTSSGKCDIIITALVQAVNGFAVHFRQTNNHPGGALGAWLVGEPEPGFTVDRTAVLKAPDESGRKVRYDNHPLDVPEVANHIREGMRVQQIALTYEDRISFICSEDMELSSIKLLDVDAKLRTPEEEADAFDADVTLHTAELRVLVHALTEAFGGLAPIPEPAKPQQLDMVGELQDDLYHDAMRIVLTEEKASISLVQRHLKIGYNRAARLLEMLERQGVVSAMAPDGKRTIIKPTI